MAEKIRTTPKIRRLLDNLSIEELQFFSNIGKNKDFPMFKNFIQKTMNYEKDYFFTFPEENPQKLAIEKAHARGKVASLTELLYIIASSVNEIEKRLKGD